MQPQYAGVLLGYFFGPKRDNPPVLQELRDLRARDAVMVRLFGHLDIRNGIWPVIGRFPDWVRADWPVPPFVRRPSLGPAMLVTRADDDPSKIVSAVAVRDESALSGTVPEGLIGSTLAANLLTKSLN